MLKKFQRKVEDFICENCGKKVIGNGYTNHCPECLYSKHVDINPGDRLNLCGGLMKPVSVTLKNGEYVIIHRCIVCGFEKNNKTSSADNFNKILEI
ncbi:MAG: hypothetical protein NVSMB66_3190 [Candidatus Doudnabacteria bacterium]